MLKPSARFVATSIVPPWNLEMSQMRLFGIRGLDDRRAEETGRKDQREPGEIADILGVCLIIGRDY